MERLGSLSFMLLGEFVLTCYQLCFMINYHPSSFKIVGSALRSTNIKVDDIVAKERRETVLFML
jgi:hypothetical protein